MFQEEIPPMSDEEFAWFGKLIREMTGIVLTENKRCMLTSRLAREVRKLGLRDFASYRRLIASPGRERELDAFTSAVTTNVTSFFRGADQFVALANLLPELQQKTRNGHRVRIWSAGCSTGQEPYSIAMTVLEHWPDAARADVLVLATDIDFNVVEEARLGIYDAKAIDSVSPQMLEKFFDPDSQMGTYSISKAVRSIVRFEQLNLLEQWPFRGQFDIIFCRNVVIYFDAETRKKLWLRFAERLNAGSWFFVGHSERIDQGLQSWIKPAGVTRYQRTNKPIDEKWRVLDVMRERLMP
jgi:chemotaxis protein methyltransferase CheR